MENWELWQHNEEIRVFVDEIFAESDEITIALLIKIADIALSSIR